MTNQHPKTKAPPKISSVIALGIMVSSSIVSISTLITKVVKNKALLADSSSFDEAIYIASAIPEIADFIQEQSISKIFASRYQDIWIVEFYSCNQEAQAAT